MHMELVKKKLSEEDYLNLAMKKSYVWQTCGLKRKKKRKTTYSMGGNETEIDFVLVGKNNRN